MRILVGCSAAWGLITGSYFIYEGVRTSHPIIGAVLATILLLVGSSPAIGYWIDRR